MHKLFQLTTQAGVARAWLQRSEAGKGTISPLWDWKEACSKAQSSKRRVACRSVPVTKNRPQ